MGGHIYDYNYMNVITVLAPQMRLKAVHQNKLPSGGVIKTALEGGKQNCVEKAKLGPFWACRGGHTKTGSFLYARRYPPVNSVLGPQIR